MDTRHVTQSQPLRFLACLSLLVAFMLSFIAVSRAETVAEKWVVVVGVTYGRPDDAEAGISALRNTVSDAQEFVRFLHAPSDHVLALFDAPGRPQTQRPT